MRPLRCLMRFINKTHAFKSETFRILLKEEIWMLHLKVEIYSAYTAINVNDRTNGRLHMPLLAMGNVLSHVSTKALLNKILTVWMSCEKVWNNWWKIALFSAGSLAKY